MKIIEVVIADDHTLVRNGICSLLEDIEEIQVTGVASNGKEALQEVENKNPDILVADIRMPEIDGLEVAKRLVEKPSNTKTLILSVHNYEEYILKAIEAGASGYLLKDTTEEELVKAIKTIYEGDKYFGNNVSHIIINSLYKKQKPDKEKQLQHADKENGNSYSVLTKKEQVVLEQIVDGKNSREISEELGTSVRTVNNQRASIMKKLKVNNTAELVRLAIEKKMV